MQIPHPGSLYLNFWKISRFCRCLLRVRAVVVDRLRRHVAAKIGRKDEAQGITLQKIEKGRSNNFRFN
jgi:hypothetical protein